MSRRYAFDEGYSTLEIAVSGSMTVPRLKKLAALTGEKLPTRKADLAAVIVRHLDGDGLRAEWERLDRLQQAAVAEVVHSHSTLFDAERFRAKYDRDPGWGVLSDYRKGTPSRLRFFFYGGFMPADLKKRLSVFVPPPVENRIQTLDRPRVHGPESGTKDETLLTVRRMEVAAGRELLSVLRLADAGKLAVSTRTLRPSSRTVSTVDEVLEDGDYYPSLPVTGWVDENAGPIRSFAWPLIIQAGKLVELSGSKLRLTGPGRKALSAPPGETIRNLWTRWLDTTIIDELSRIDCVKGQTGRAKRGLTAVSGRRAALASALADCPQGRWISVDEFLRFLRATGNDFPVARDAWNLYIAEAHYGSLGYDGSLEPVEDRYRLCFLLEYAATLGLIDVALVPPAGARRDYGTLWGTDDLPYLSRYDGLMCFRITPLGAYCLGSDPSYQPEAPEPTAILRVLPNLQIAAIDADLDVGEQMALDSFATRVSDLVWELDAGRLLAAVDEGQPITEIKEFLESRAAAPIPDTVERLLEDVASREGQVRDVGLARLIECASPALASLIANDTSTAKYCLQAGDRCLVVPGSSEAAFRRALRKIGYLLAPGDVAPGNSRT